jgi:Outer membrane protein beta-barrel domain
MKTLAGCALVALAITVETAAQVTSGSWELSLSATMGSVSSSTEYTYGGKTSTYEGEAETYLSLAIRPGFFVVDGLSIEPELLWTAIEGDRPAIAVLGGLSYTFTIPESPVAPFILVGYGIGNGIPIAQRLIGRTSSDFDVSALNVGGGLKVFVSPNVAFRAEYRYQRYSWQEEITFSWNPEYLSTFERVTAYHNIFIGISVFFPSK